MRHSVGFTIIELIVVIVLISIVGVVIVPRFMSPNAFNEGAATDALISTIRAAQQAALGRADVSFQITTAGGNWVLTAKTGMTTIRSMEIPTDDVILETGTALSLLACSASFDDAITAGSGFTLSFDGRGNLANLSNGAVDDDVSATFNGARICVNDTDARSVCVSPGGYAYAGNCDE